MRLHLCGKMNPIHKIRKLPKSLQSPRYTTYLDLYQAETPTISDVNYLVDQVSPPRNETELCFVTSVIRRIMAQLQGVGEENSETLRYLNERLYQLESGFGYVNRDDNLLIKRQKR